MKQHKRMDIKDVIEKTLKTRESKNLGITWPDNFIDELTSGAQGLDVSSQIDFLNSSIKKAEIDYRNSKFRKSGTK